MLTAIPNLHAATIFMQTLHAEGFRANLDLFHRSEAVHL